MHARTLLIAACVLGCGGGGDGPQAPPAPQSVGSVRGSAVDEAGAPVAGVGVQLSRSGHGTRTTASDATGAFAFTAVPTGAWALSASPPAGFTAAGALTASIQVAAEALTTVPPLLLRREVAPPGGDAALVTMTDNAFTPGSLTVARGRTVRWQNGGSAAHNSTSSTGLWASGDLQPSQNFERAFTQAGTFNYSCTLHPGMNGTVIVQ
jgi:plastocyanin